MSLIHDVGKKLEHLPGVIDTYSGYLEDFESNLKIEGKNLERANVEQASWGSYYDQRRIELRTLVKFMESELERIRGKLWTFYTEKYSRDLGTRDKDQYINNDQEYLSYLELFLEVKELHDKFEAVVDAFKSRGFALRNITDLRVHSLADANL